MRHQRSQQQRDAHTNDQRPRVSQPCARTACVQLQRQRHQKPTRDQRPEHAEEPAAAGVDVVALTSGGNEGGKTRCVGHYSEQRRAARSGHADGITSYAHVDEHLADGTVLHGLLRRGALFERKAMHRQLGQRTRFECA